MKDFRGITLEEGQKVAYLRTYSSSSELKEAEVIGFTEKMVRIMEYNRFGRPTSTLVTPIKLAVL